MNVATDDTKRALRVAWLPNHTTLRQCEVPLIRSLGFEVYTSKLLPRNNLDLTGSEDLSEDQYSTLPALALSTLNAHNFFDDRFSTGVIDALNNHFDTVIALGFGKMLPEVVRHFRGRILIRVFGREQPHTYGELFRQIGGTDIFHRIKQIQSRFWFAPAYDSIPLAEDGILRERSMVLPAGLPKQIWEAAGTWIGSDSRLLFLCPRIASYPAYWGAIYNDFKRIFGDLPHVIGGPQPTPMTSDAAVKGEVPEAEYRRWFRECRVMFYHSREPRHLHYAPVEAMIYGMPVVFMRGGILESFGGKDQPGACDSFAEARDKVERILQGDDSLIAAIRKQQAMITRPFGLNYCADIWKTRFAGQIMRAPIRDQ